jgi:hypothetical protein
MGCAVSVFRLNVDELKEAAEALRTKFPAGMRRAMKRAATSARAEIVRLMVADLGGGITAKYVRNEIKVRSDEKSASLEVEGFRIPLIQFKARGPEPSRGRGRGVTYSLGGSRGRVASAFITTMPSGHRGVFQRTTKTRKPIVELRGPSLTRVFDKYAPVAARQAGESLAKNIQSEIQYAMSRR